jgi:hypothetical protein
MRTQTIGIFIEHVKGQVVISRPGICLISDTHSDILAAICQLQQGSGIHDPSWPDVRSRWYMRYMVAHFYVHFKNNDLMNLFKMSCG